MNKSKKRNKKNTKRKIKNKTLRKNKKKYIKGGTTIYYMDTDNVKHTNLTYNGLPFFRKVFINPPHNEEQKYLIGLTYNSNLYFYFCN